MWRRAWDCQISPEMPAVSLPDNKQHQVSSAIHGLFKPWALLKMPMPSLAFRFVYPTLIVACWDQMYLWDVPTGMLIQTIAETQDGVATRGDINYIEVSPRHAFICGSNLLRIFSRELGKCVLDIPSTQFSFADWSYSLIPCNPLGTSPGAVLFPHDVVPESQRVRPPVNYRVIDQFIAGAHVTDPTFTYSNDPRCSPCIRVWFQSGCLAEQLKDNCDV